MREFKFRAWDTESSRMVYDPYFFDVYHFSDENRVNQKTYRYYEDWRDLEDGRGWECELMQYVGLKDKNGKEIYEGDLIRFLNGETTSTESGMECDEFLTDGAVFWDDESAQWDITHRIDVSREDVFTDISEYEVVGNIYENPNLLK